MPWLAMIKLPPRPMWLVRDVRQPWLWPLGAQRFCVGAAVVLGVVLSSPAGYAQWQSWQDAQNRLQAMQDAQAQILHMQHTMAQWQQQPVVATLRADAQALVMQAQSDGLAMSHMTQDLATPPVRTLPVQQLPVHLQVQGSWAAWLHWLGHLPENAPGVTLHTLALKGTADGQLSANVGLHVPQLLLGADTWQLSSLPAETPAENTNPLSADVWLQAQQRSVQQHPSYAQQVGPELNRQPDPLEAYARDQLKYIGHIRMGTRTQALVQVAGVATVHRLQVGQHLGQSFGRVQAIHPEALQVQELVRQPSGEWRTQDVQLPLQQGSP